MENRFTGSLTVFSKCNIWCKDLPYCSCLRCYSSWLRQWSCLYPSRTPITLRAGKLCFRTGPCIPSRDGAGLDSMMPAEHSLVHREDLSLEYRIMPHFRCSQHLPCLLKQCFPSPRFVHLVLIKRKKASRDMGVAAVSYEAQVLGFF